MYLTCPGQIGATETNFKQGTFRSLCYPTYYFGGDLASTWVAKPEVHAEVQDTS